MNALLKWARWRGLVPALLTLTGRHRITDPLARLINGMKEAKRRLHQSRDWRGISALVGHVTATEVTDGRNGWHVHYHSLVLMEAPNEAAAMALLAGLRTVWERALEREGLDCNDHGFDVQGAARAGDYVSKWGAAEELCLSGNKEVRDTEKGRTVWELLSAAAEGDALSAARWKEYASAFKGRRQLVWSRGLKAAAGINEKSDEELAAEIAAGSIEIGRMSANQWRAVVRAGFRCFLLEAVESEGWLGFERVMLLVCNLSEKNNGT